MTYVSPFLSGPAPKRLLALLVLLAGLVTASFGQVDGQFDQTGGSTDYATSNIHFTIPVRTKAGGFAFSLDINSHAYVAPDPIQHLNEWYLGTSIATNGGLEWSIVFQHTYQIDGGYCTVYADANVRLPNGTMHPLPSTFTQQYGTVGYHGASCYTGPPSGLMTVDGSAITVITTNSPPSPWIAYDKGGNSYALSGGPVVTSGAFTDPNGNTIYGAGSGNIIDELNTTAITAAHNQGPGGTPGDTYSYQDASNNTQTFVVNYTQYTQGTYFQCSAIRDLDTAGAGFRTVWLPTSIVLPSNQGEYQLTYEADPQSGYSQYTTGRLTSISFPQGGSVSYAYSGGNNGIYCNTAVVPTLTITRNDGDTAGVYSVNNSWTTLNTTGPSIFTVTQTNNVDNAKSVTTYMADADPNLMYGGTLNWATKALLPTEKQVYQGSTLLSTTITCYNGNNASPASCPSPAAAIYYPITQTDTYSHFGLMGTTTNHIFQTFDSYSNPLITNYYDWGTWGGPLLRTHQLAYGSGHSCANVGSYIHNRVCTDTVSGGTAPGGTAYRYAYYTYDAHGNLTGSSKQLTASTYLNYTYVANANGTVASATQTNNGITTSFTYDDCNGLLLTKATLPVSGAGWFSQTWDCNGGVVSSRTEESNNSVEGGTVTFAYADPLYRLTSISYPDSSYDVDTVAYSTGWPLTVTKTTALSPSNTTGLSVATEYNAFGHPFQTTATDPNSSSGYRTTLYTYNGLGEMTSATNPYFSTADATYGVTSYTYDALGRITSVTRPDNSIIYSAYNNRDKEVYSSPASALTAYSEVDGMGRTVLLCRGISAGQQANGDSPKSCGLADVSATGFSNALQYDPASDLLSSTYPANLSSHELKAYAYDMAGRVTSRTLPESGTDSYVYDTQLVGALYSHTDARNITATYTHDNVYRLTGGAGTPAVQFSDGTPSIYTAYDTGYCFLNEYPGQLTALFTPRSVGYGSYNTEVSFSYDIMNRVNAECEATPLETSVNSSFQKLTRDFAGNITLLEDWDTSYNLWAPYNSLTYTRNSIGQVTSITPSYTGGTGDNVPASIMSAGIYNALGQVTSFTGMQTGDNHQLSYNNLGQVTSNEVAFNIAYNVAGDVTSRYTISEGTWSYTYDPAFPHRLASASCPPSGCFAYGYGTTGIALSWTYDEYDNRWSQAVTAGSGPQPSYSFDLHNHITNAAPLAYDAAGNMINDGTYAYTFDAMNRITSDGSTGNVYTYDGVSNRVETQYGNGSVFDFVYLGSQYMHMNAPTGTYGWVQVENEATGLGQYDGAPGGMTYFQSYQAPGSGSTLWQLEYNAPYGSEWAYLPFGDDRVVTWSRGPDTSLANEFLFGQLFSDSPTNDHATARELTATQGRWFSPDPANAGWNAYVYADNNPVTENDPLGLEGNGIASLMDWEMREMDNDAWTNPFAGVSYSSSRDTQTAQPIGQVDIGDDSFAVRGTLVYFHGGPFSKELGEGDVDRAAAQAVGAQNHVTPQSLRDQIPGNVRVDLAHMIPESNSPTADDKQGGFHEMYAVAGLNASGEWVVSRDEPGPYGNPDTDTHLQPSFRAANPALAYSIVQLRVTAHVHPAGVTAKGNYWKQPPQTADTTTADPSVINIVFGALHQKVYFYGNSGIIGAPMKLEDFLPR